MRFACFLFHMYVGTLVALSSGLPAEVTVTSYPSVKDQLTQRKNLLFVLPIPY